MTMASWEMVRRRMCRLPPDFLLGSKINPYLNPEKFIRAELLNGKIYLAGGLMEIRPLTLKAMIQYLINGQTYLLFQKE